MRGDVHRLRSSRLVRGHEQTGDRCGVIVQSDDLLLSTMLVAPTSRSASKTIFRPTITVSGESTHVLVEQTAAVAPERLGDLVGHLTQDEISAVESALALVFQLD